MRHDVRSWPASDEASRSIGTATRTFTFDEPVTIDPGAFVIHPAATPAVKPSLGATASTFEVVATGLEDGTD